MCRRLTNICQLNADQLQYISAVELKFGKDNWAPGTLPKSELIVWQPIDVELRHRKGSKVWNFKVPLDAPAFTASVEGTLAATHGGLKATIEAVIALRQAGRREGKEMIIMILLPRQLRVANVAQFVMQVKK